MNLSTNVQAPQALIDAIDEYQTRFREKRFMPISKVYDLFPAKRHATDNWPNPWPLVRHDDGVNWYDKGVYFMFDAQMTLVYIGKTSFGSDFFKRFVSYFSGSTKTPCTIKDAKFAAVKYIALLCMKDPHDAPSMEEFLIEKFASPTLLNSVGNRHNARYSAVRPSPATEVADLLADD